MRNGHEEVARQLLGLGELRRHVGEATRKVRDLVAATRRRQLDAVVPGSHLVGRLRQPSERLGDPAGEVQAEQRRDHDAPAERDREPLQEGDRAAAELRGGLRDDECAEEVVAEAQRPCDGDVLPTAEPDVERRRPLLVELADAHHAARKIRNLL